MARTIATNTRVGREELLEFLRPRHHAILMTTRRDGRPQASPNTCGVDAEGRIVISTYPERAKAHEHPARPAGRRSACSPTTSAGRGCRSTAPPRCSTCPRRWSRWSSTSGCISGEHPDWDEYRQAMRDQGKSLIRITIDRWGPIATGGFPARLAD